MSERQRIDRAAVAYCAARLDLRSPVRTFALSMRAERRANREGRDLQGRYTGRDAHGIHCVEIANSRRGVGRLNTIAHELTHARQAEDYGDDQFDQLYALETKARGYERNYFEVEARESARMLAAEMAALPEFDTI